jgi:hypothetical protein
MSLRGIPERLVRMILATPDTILAGNRPERRVMQGLVVLAIRRFAQC